MIISGDFKIVGSENLYSIVVEMSEPFTFIIKNSSETILAWNGQKLIDRGDLYVFYWYDDASSFTDIAR